MKRKPHSRRKRTTKSVLALVSTKVRWFFRMSKHLPVEPSPEWFRENIHAIAHRLKKETKASVAFCSLPPIGEDPTSIVALQSELNRRIEEYSGTIRDVAMKEDVNYIPLHEEMLAHRWLPNYNSPGTA